ncbi:MAG: 3-dehydroquinate synthase, partial [Clostridia bacterium]|nr:3-dehydroquinate synthase [Clostridia bacterium]
ITLVSVPTTLLSAVDSSVGGKTAIDLAAGKNLCGTFYQPSAVYIALSFLRTLPKREVQSGLGEVIKYAFLSDTVNAEDIKRADGELVFKCLKIKRDIVNADEKENGARALLNFGHTVGHAIEKLSGYRLSHGLCVAKGMACAVAVSQRIYGLSDQTVAKMRQLLEISKHDLTNTFSAADITDAIKADKKRKGDCVNFIVVKDIGKPQIVKIRFSVLAEIIKEYENKNKAI